jgi:hypothetical protein
MISAKWLKHVIVTINRDKKKTQKVLINIEIAKNLTKTKKKQKVDQIQMSDCHQFFEYYWVVW